MTKKILERLIICTALAVLMLAVSVAVSGQMQDAYWDKIPEVLKAHLTTTDYSDDEELSIMCFALTDQTAKVIWPDESKKRNMRDVVETIMKGHSMLVYVAPYDNNYFWPTSFNYTQGITQYKIGYDYYALSDAFGGGEMKADTVAFGIIRIPDGIDTSKVFKIWYDDESAPVGPINFDDAGKL